MPPLLVFLLTPFYFKYLGAESFGLISFFTLLTTLANVFDFGIGAAINREISKNKNVALSPLIRSVEILHATIGLSIGLVIIFIAPSIVKLWLLVPDATLAIQAVRLTAIGLLFQWPISFYFGVASGLNRQVEINTLRLVMAVISTCGTLILMGYFDAKLLTVISWQVAVTMMQLLLAHYFLWKKSEPVSWTCKWTHIKQIKGFAVPMSAVTVIGIVIMNSDKVILSKVLSLESFGYYNSAALLASSLYFIISPLHATLFPKFCAASSDACRALYESSLHVLCLLTAPLAALLVFFSEDILQIWIGDGAHDYYGIVSLLAIGTYLNGISNIPSLVLLATGKIRFQLILSLILTLLVLPFSIWGAFTFGAIGPASLWIVFNALYLCVLALYVHRYKSIYKEIAFHTLFVFSEAFVLKQVLPSPQGLVGLSMVGLLLLATSFYLFKNKLRGRFADASHSGTAAS